MSDSTEEIIQNAISEAKAGNREAAKKALSQVVRQEPNNARAWYLLSQVVEKKEQAVYCLEKVLKLQPDNQQAKERLTQLADIEDNTGNQHLLNHTPRSSFVLFPIKKTLDAPPVDYSTKECPCCGEVIQGEAKICESCGLDLTVEGQDRQQQSAQIQHLGKNPIIDIDNMNGFQFEELVKKLLEIMGLEVQLTRKTGDGGIDIIAHSEETITGGKYIIQCKRHLAKIGEPQIRDLFGVVHHENASKGILITNSDFTQQAQKFAEGKPIELIDGIKLKRLLIEYGISTAEDVPNEKTKVLRLPKELKELAINILRIRDDLEIKLGELDLLMIEEKKIFVPEIDYPDYLNKAGEDFPSLVQQICNVISDFSSQPIEKISDKFIKSRTNIINQIIDAHFRMIRTIEQIDVVVESESKSKNLFGDLELLFEELKQAAIEFNKDYLRQLIIFFSQFQKPIDLNGKVVDIDYLPIVPLKFEPNINESSDKIIQITNLIRNRYQRERNVYDIEKEVYEMEKEIKVLKSRQISSLMGGILSTLFILFNMILFILGLHNSLDNVMILLILGFGSIGVIGLFIFIHNFRFRKKKIMGLEYKISKRKLG